MQNLDARRFDTYRTKLELPATFSCILPLGMQNTQIHGYMRSAMRPHALIQYQARKKDPE